MSLPETIVLVKPTIRVSSPTDNRKTIPGLKPTMRLSSPTNTTPFLKPSETV